LAALCLCSLSFLALSQSLNATEEVSLNNIIIPEEGEGKPKGELQSAQWCAGWGPQRQERPRQFPGLGSRHGSSCRIGSAPPGDLARCTRTPFLRTCAWAVSRSSSTRVLLSANVSQASRFLSRGRVLCTTYFSGTGWGLGNPRHFPTPSRILHIQRDMRAPPGAGRAPRSHPRSEVKRTRGGSSSCCRLAARRRSPPPREERRRPLPAAAVDLLGGRADDLCLPYEARRRGGPAPPPRQPCPAPLPHPRAGGEVVAAQQEGGLLCVVVRRGSAPAP
jgi:hypothetical protein